MPVFDLKTCVNSVGLVLTIAGVVVIYRYSPLNSSESDGGAAGTDFVAIKGETALKNRLMKVGTALVLLGSALQLASNFVAP